MASMGLRTIEYTVTSTGITPCTEQDGGVQGEHHITDVVFSLSSELQAKLSAQETAGYTIAYRLDGRDGAGGYYASELLTPVEGSLTFPLPRALTGAGGVVLLNLVIAAVSEDGDEPAVEEMTLYTYTARLRLAESAYGARGRTAFTEEMNQEITGALAQLQDIQRQVEDAVVHGPKIEDGTWRVWDFDTDSYVDTGVFASNELYSAVLDGINYRYDVTTGRYTAAEEIVEGTALLVYVTQGNAPWANLYVDGIKVGSHNGLLPSSHLNGGNLYNPGGVDDTAKAKGFDQEGYYLCRYTGTYWETRRVGDQYSQAETDALLAGKGDAVQGVYYGECSSGHETDGTIALTVDDGFVLETGAKVLVRFVTAGRINNTKLNVNGTGAYTIVYRTTTGNYAMGAGSTRLFVYAGENWRMEGDYEQDKMVSQNTTTTNYDFRVLFSCTPDDTNETNTARKAPCFTANPSTGVLSATSFKEDGTALADKYAAVSRGVYYGEDSNAADLNERPVTVDEGFALEAGVSIRVRFVNGVTVRGAKLDINGTGAAEMRYRGNRFTANIHAMDTIDFVYDGTYWVVIGQFDTDSLVSQLPKSDDVNYHLLCSSSGDIAGTTTYATKNAAFTANPSTGVLSATAFKENGTLLSEKYAAAGVETMVALSTDTASPTALASGKTYVVTSTVGSNNYYAGIPDNGRVTLCCTANPVGCAVYAVNASTTQYVVITAGGVTTNTTGLILAHNGGGTQWGYYRLDLVQAGTVMYITVQGGGVAAS